MRTVGYTICCRVSNGTTGTTGGVGTLSFDSVGGSSVPQKTYTIGCKLFDLYEWTLPVPNKANAIFEGWYYDSSYTRKVDNWDVLSDVQTRLYARWGSEGTKVTVSFDSRGGSPCDSRQYTFGGKYESLPTPTKSGFDFVGWYLDLEFTKQVLPTTEVLSSVTTLYAKWTGGYVSAEKTVVLDWSGVLLGDSSDTSLQGSGEWKLAQAYPSWIGGCSLYVPGGASGKLTDSAYVSMSGSFVFGIYATENNSSSERSCVLSLYNKTSGKVEYKINVRQRAKSSQGYSVVLNRGDGSGQTKSYTVSEGDWTLPTIASMSWTRLGYDFLGWGLSATQMSWIYKDGKTVWVDGPLELYAKWQESAQSGIVSVSFETRGGSSCSSRDYVVGRTYGSLPSTTQEGYTFLGWYANDSVWSPRAASAVYTTTEVSSSVTTLYARWRANSYTVKLDQQGGSGGTGSVRVQYGDITFRMPSITLPTRPGYRFEGYFTERNGSGTQYYNADGSACRAWGIAGDATLFALWRANVYTLTLGPNGGTGGSDKVEATKGQPMPAATAPTKSGYVFDGYWDTTKDGGKQYYDANMKSVRNWDKDGNVTLWAKWVKEVACKVTFGKNGGTGGDSYVTAIRGKPMPTPRTAPKLSGYTFCGYWDTLALDDKGNPKGKQYYDANMRSVRAWDKTSAATLWAKWTNKVTFGKNGGTGGDSYVTVTKGQPMPKRAMPTKSGYVFDGYWTSTGAGGVKYYNANGTSAHVWDRKGDTTLWAKWVKTVACKVTFGKNGGSGGDSFVTATYGKPMPTPRTAPKLSGYTFGGYWDTLAMDAKGNPKGKQYYDAKMKSVRNWDKKSATTLWAKWTNKVTFGKNGGTGGDNYVTCTRGQPMPKRAMPTKSGYAFDGYWTSTGAGGVKYYNADGTSAHTWDKKGDTTLWAKWVKPVACRVTFGKNGGTGGDSYVTATTGKAMPTPRTAPKRTGWTFGGYWDTLACDASGNPKGKQYYDANMKSVRAWDKTSAATLWAKWTVRVKLGKNGGTGGDDYATVIYNQPFPKRAMPKRTGYVFGGYWVSVSRKTGQCYNADGRGTASMKWTTGGTPTIWALWTKRSSSVEIPQPAAVSSASAAPAAAVVAAVEPAESAIPAGIYSGVLADGAGAFWLMLDEPEEGCDRTAYLYVASEDGVFTAECTAEDAGGVLLLTTEDGEVYAFDPAAAILTATD